MAATCACSGSQTQISSAISGSDYALKLFRASEAHHRHGSKILFGHTVKGVYTSADLMAASNTTLTTLARHS